MSTTKRKPAAKAAGGDARLPRAEAIMRFMGRLKAGDRFTLGEISAELAKLGHHEPVADVELWLTQKEAKLKKAVQWLEGWADIIDEELEEARTIDRELRERHWGDGDHEEEDEPESERFLNLSMQDVHIQRLRDGLRTIAMTIRLFGL
jgi:hypothetical protein